VLAVGQNTESKSQYTTGTQFRWRFFRGRLKKKKKLKKFFKFGNVFEVFRKNVAVVTKNKLSPFPDWNSSRGEEKVCQEDPSFDCEILP